MVDKKPLNEKKSLVNTKSTSNIKSSRIGGTVASANRDKLKPTASTNKIGGGSGLKKPEAKTSGIPARTSAQKKPEVQRPVSGISSVASPLKKPTSAIGGTSTT